MELERRITLSFRWALITTVITALFWTIWFLVTKNVPSDSHGVSRWWDILIVPIWTVIAIFSITDPESTHYNPFSFIFGFSIILCTLLCLKEGFIAGLALAILVSLIIFLFIGLWRGITFLFNKMAKKEFWCKIGRWLIAKE